MTVKETLKTYFGYDSFRDGQEVLIDAILAGQDVLGVMPTGAGKSVCYQLPAMLTEGITLVVSPLISLMKDQVGALLQSGIAAAYINSTLSPAQMVTALFRAKQGAYKLIYVAPERLLAPDFLDFAQKAPLAMLSVDEAHCISQWGQDFRPSYAQIPQFIATLPRRPVVSAFTATATARVREDIIKLLAMQSPKQLVTGFDRKNLYFEVRTPKRKQDALFAFLHENHGQNGIIYCSTRKTVEEVCAALHAEGFSATRYHAGLSDSERHGNQDDFLFDRVQIMVATNAFGMGIDKSNVNFVVHFNMPKDIESYYQEAGRAGRDGSPARCLLLYAPQDVMTNRRLIEHARETLSADAETQRLLRECEHRRLREMTFYSTTNDCLRAFLLRYFGENPPNFCGSCGNCDTQFETVDVTEDAQKILSCVARMHGRFGMALVIDVLRGAKTERVFAQGFEKLSTYGISNKSIHSLRAVMEHLLREGYLQTSGGEFPVLGLTSASRAVLQGERRLEMKLAKEKEPRPTHKTATGQALPESSRALFERLRTLRGNLAKEQGVPAYVVFADSALADMCVRQPRTPDEFLQVLGVGNTKLERYGEAFLREIKAFCEEQGLETTLPIQKQALRTAEIVLPDDNIMREIELPGKLVPVSLIADAINAPLRLHGCSTVSALRIADWLVAQGYLKVVQQDGVNIKVPTEKGIAAGITQEERTNSRGDYMQNQYPPAVQQYVVEHLQEVLLYKKPKSQAH